MVFPQKFPVAEGHSARSIYSEDVLIKLSDFHYYASFVPFIWVGANLVLDTDMVSDFELL